MIYISHRGNLRGAQPEDENNPDYLAHAMEQRYRCEADLWVTDKGYWLGHDEPQYKADPQWLLDYRDRLVLHCKNAEALASLRSVGAGFNYFWHQEDDYTLTSIGWIWAYPERPAPKVRPNLSITVALGEGYPWEEEGFAGICSDYIEGYRHD